jgi:transcriptional regulator with XRE-family HTH domain
MQRTQVPTNVPDPSPESTSEVSAAVALGSRLRAIRLARGIGVRELARRLDLSPSAISQIENGKVNPSVRTLYAFASEFAVTVDEMLFDQAQPSRGSAAEPDASLTTTGPGLSVQRVGGRPAITLNSGVEWERLMFWDDEDVEFIEATYAPGGASSPDDKLVRHDGHEFGYILTGTLRVVVGFDDFVLGSGDSISFPSTTPHRLSNEGDETVRAVWVVRGRRGVSAGNDGPHSRNE